MKSYFFWLSFEYPIFSQSPHASVTIMRIENKKNYYANLDAEIASLSLEHGPQSAPALRLRLFKFFRLARLQGLIGSFDPKNELAFDPLLQELTQALREKAGFPNFSASRFLEFNNTDHKSCHFAKRYVVPICKLTPELKSYKSRKNQALRVLWRSTMGLEAGAEPHFFRRFSRTGAPKTVPDNCPLMGDYLLFSADAAGYARPSFFRFYVHDTGAVRCLWLRLDDPARRIGAKGWAINQQNAQVYVVGYLERRKPRAVVENAGGAICLSVSYDQTHFLNRTTNEKITHALVLFHHLPFEEKATASRGVLIRFTGVEHLGGQESHSKEDRARETYSLQKKLIDEFGCQLDLADCAKVLSEVSGFDERYYLEDGGVKGVFNNYPDSSGHVQGLPIAPLSVHLSHTLPRATSGEEPKEDIYFDAKHPPGSFVIARNRYTTPSKQVRN